MKLKMTVLFAAILFSSSALMANSIEGKLGAASLKNADDKIGFDAALDYNIQLDPFFALSPEIGFHWLSFDQTKEIATATPGVTESSVVNTDFYTFPLMLNAKVYPFAGAAGAGDFGGGEPVLSPYLLIGGGWAFMFGESDYGNSSYNGFAYQALVGTTVRLGSGGSGDFGGTQSAVKLLLEGGYRGGKLADTDDSNIEVDMSGWIIRAGVNYEM